MFKHGLKMVGVALAVTFTAVSALAQKVQIFVGTDYPFGVAHIAAAKGFYTKHGLDVTVNTFNTGTDATLAMRSAGAGYVLSGDLPSAKLWAIGDVVGIAPVTWDDSSLAILAISSITKPSDLKGKKVATPLGSTGEIFFINYLKQNGMSRKDVDMINLTPGDMPAAMANGDIVAYLWNQPTTAAGLKAVKGAHFLTDGSKGFGINRVMLNAARSTAENQPDQVIAMVRSLLDAIRLLKSNPDECYPIIAKALSTSVENVKKNIAVFHYDMTLDKGFVDDMTTKVTIAAEVGIVKEPIKWKTQWMSKFARTVDPALVAVQP
jgi:ABC-type nitrate/sulfonate/bicarbonate transport system substrate-binding protein